MRLVLNPSSKSAGWKPEEPGDVLVDLFHLGCFRKAQVDQGSKSSIQVWALTAQPLYVLSCTEVMVVLTSPGGCELHGEGCWGMAGGALANWRAAVRIWAGMLTVLPSLSSYRIT